MITKTHKPGAKKTVTKKTAARAKPADSRRTAKLPVADTRATVDTTPNPAMTKIDQMVSMLCREEGASIAELAAATGWLPHSVRGALAGQIKQKGHEVVSEKTDDVRCYRIKTAI
jgi:hypothetical protein